MVAVPSIGRASQVTPRRAAPEADATRDLYERYARQIYAYCLHQLGNKEEAEDAMQSAFLNAFRGFKRGVDPEFESAWLYKIAQNVCLTRQRSSSRRRRVESPGDLDAMQDVLPAHSADSDELIGLPEALGEMPEQQRRALLLREWQGLSYKEIADELDLSQAAVETLLFRARRSLAAGLTEQGAGKRVLAKLRAGGDAGSVLALLQGLFLSGGAKVAVTVAAVAATSVVAATPQTRHAVEHAVAPAPQHSATRVHLVPTGPARHIAAASAAAVAQAPAAAAAAVARVRVSARTRAWRRHDSAMHVVRHAPVKPAVAAPVIAPTSGPAPADAPTGDPPVVVAPQEAAPVPAAPTPTRATAGVPPSTPATDSNATKRDERDQRNADRADRKHDPVAKGSQPLVPAVPAATAPASVPANAVAAPAPPVAAPVAPADNSVPDRGRSDRRDQGDRAGSKGK